MRSEVNARNWKNRKEKLKGKDKCYYCGGNNKNGKTRCDVCLIRSSIHVLSGRIINLEREVKTWTKQMTK